MFVDSHCHLDYHERDGDLDEVIGRAHRAGVGALVTICTKMGNFGLDIPPVSYISHFLSLVHTIQE